MKYMVYKLCIYCYILVLLFFNKSKSNNSYLFFEYLKCVLVSIYNVLYMVLIIF